MAHTDGTYICDVTRYFSHNGSQMRRGGVGGPYRAHVRRAEPDEPLGVRVYGLPHRRRCVRAAHWHGPNGLRLGSTYSSPIGCQT
eukprot:7391734-Prymnesium_polylepis.1